MVNLEPSGSVSLGDLSRQFDDILGSANTNNNNSDSNGADRLGETGNSRSNADGTLIDGIDSHVRIDDRNDHVSYSEHQATRSDSLVIGSHPQSETGLGSNNEVQGLDADNGQINHGEVSLSRVGRGLDSKAYLIFKRYRRIQFCLNTFLRHDNISSNDMA